MLFNSHYQKVFLLPKTVLAMVDCESIHGRGYCYTQKKGWYEIIVSNSVRIHFIH